MGEPVIQLGRYALHAEIAAGGMATVYLARLRGAVGFGRTVAIKRLHPHLAKDPEFVSMFLDEARLAARVQHPNVVPTLDVVTSDGELFLVLEYIRGESFGALIRAARQAKQSLPINIVVALASGMLHGLHAAHEATDEQDAPLNIVHRDVSPQNVIIGADGVPRILDFGVAKAESRLQTTREGQLKGKLAYMPPEQLNGTVSRATDIYAAGVVLWEALVGQRLFKADTEVQIVNMIATLDPAPPSMWNTRVTSEIDRIVLKAISRNPNDRYATAEEMAIALEAAVPPASPREVAIVLERYLGASLDKRKRIVAEIESGAAVPGKGELLRLVDSQTSGMDVSSSPNMPRISAPPDSLPAAGNLSTASLTLSQSPPARSRTWLVGLVLVPVVGGAVVLGTYLARVPPPAATPASAPTETAVPTVSASAPEAVVSHSAPSASVAPTASTKHLPNSGTGPKPPKPPPPPSTTVTTTATPPTPSSDPNAPPDDRH